MAKYEGRRGDLTWGRYNFPVTRTQKDALDGLWYLLKGWPRAFGDTDLPMGGFYSQSTRDGSVIFGVDHRSVTVHRNGRVTPNT